MKAWPYMILFSTAMLFIVYRMTSIQYEETEMEELSHPFYTVTDSVTSKRIGNLPHGIVHSRSDMELKPLWSSELRESVQYNRNLLAMPVGIKQKKNVDLVVRKFLPENFTVILFHYDGNVNGWSDLPWSKRVIHIVAKDQTKWWFAKRFLYPDVVSIYEYIFLWDEDLGVENFHPGRYLKIMKSAGLEISQPALDPNLSEIHHQLTSRRKKGQFHRRVYDARSKRKCTGASEGPPCTGWVEGMAPVFSRSAWRCVWHLIQNDLIHGWGMDMKFGYCVQGDRTQKVGVIDSEYIVHQGVQTLGASAITKGDRTQKVGVIDSEYIIHQGVQTLGASAITKTHQRSRALDARTEIRRRARAELDSFQKRWDRAVKEDDTWIDPFSNFNSNKKHRKYVHVL